MFVVCCAATSIATANTVAIGWHSFRGVDTDGNSVTTDGTLATRVFTSNHIKGTITGAYNAWSTAANIVDTTYGDTGETFTPGDDSTGVTIDTFNTSADIVEITVINESGSSFTIDAIAFDAQATFGTGNLTVSHLSGSSELADDSTDRSLGAVALSDTSLVEQSIATTDMTDIELAVGETTAFRIQVSGSFMSVKLDNIAVMTSSTLVAPTPVTANTVVVGWNTFDGNTTTETVSEAMTGVSGTIVGGLLENDANNLDVMTYGSSSVSFTTESDLSTGIKATTNNNDQKRINLSVTNNSGADITLESIAFHAALTGNNKSILTVSHVSNQSDLDDVFNGRSLGTYGAGTDTPIPWGTNVGIEVSTLGMYDRVLGDGETATFRIELSSTDGTWSAIKLDNIAVLTYIAEPPVVADTVAIGWHSFDGDTATETASEASVGVSGTIVGGVSEVTGSNLDNQTYGDGASFTAVTDSTGITANTFNNDNKRVVITVTNGTGSDLSIDTIALDAQLIFGSGSVTVSHLSGSSALADGFTNRLLDTLTIADSVYTAVQQSVATTAMDDVVLADGETAAFRIEVVAGDGVASLGVKLDNIAVMTSTEFAAPVADTVAIGWHSFDGDTATETASEASVGVSGTIVGGVSEVTGSNLDNQTYGDGASFTAVTDSTGITANTFNNDNKRVVITVTNGTGSDLSIDTIALDAQLIFGSGSVTVSHLSGSSALADGFTNRLLDTLTIADSVYTAVQQSVATTAMDDVVLADGETAAFRIEVVAGDGVASLGVKLDNIAVMTSTELEEPPFDDNAVVLAAWTNFTIGKETRNDADGNQIVNGNGVPIQYSKLIDEAPDYTTSGVTASLGQSVQASQDTVGGGSEGTASSGDFSYGSAYAISAVNLDSANPTAITLTTFGANNWYVDFSITNNTGSDLQLSGIHFDAQSSWMADRVVDDNDTPDDTSDDVVIAEGTPHTVEVSHFNDVSDLTDTFNNRKIGTATTSVDFLQRGIGIDLSVLTDTLLADGESAAFRLKLVNPNGVNGGLRIDNLAITGTPAGTIRTLTVDTSAVEAGAGSVDLNGSRKYVDGETVSITATAAEGYTFTGWSGASDSTDATISVTLSADTTLTPNFAAAPTELPTLSISSDGTNVTLTWEGIATLKRADSLSAGFSEVTGAESPHTETVSGEKFYRLEQ
jgi:uncharacterized repeat protein (TIGR02543 family)